MRAVAVEVCIDRRVQWSLGDQQPGCVDPRHSHRRMEVHVHDDVVVLPDGAPITAVSFVSGEPYRRDRIPDFGLYLDPIWDPPWPHAHLDWPDFGVPRRTDVVLAALDSLHERARAGEQVEIGCLGAHGRTGTALALLATSSGVPAATAVDWVRTAYCPLAVETSEQAAFVAGASG
jgi:hypothetical protein